MKGREILFDISGGCTLVGKLLSDFPFDKWFNWEKLIEELCDIFQMQLCKIIINYFKKVLQSMNFLKWIDLYR